MLQFSYFSFSFVIWLIIPIFRKNGYVPEKNFQWEKIFKIDIFVLKHVLDDSKSIPTQKIFSKNFQFIGH